MSLLSLNREAEFAELECRLSDEQAAAYDAASEVWQALRATLVEAVAGGARETRGVVVPGGPACSCAICFVNCHRQDGPTPPASPALHTHAAAATASSKDVWKPFWAAQQRFFKLL